MIYKAPTSIKNQGA